MAASAEDTTDSRSASRCLVVDEAAFEEQFLRCSVCQERYSTEERPPKSLPCNHTFCLVCLKQVFDHHQPNARRALVFADDNIEGVLKCPTCRVEIYLSRSEIGALPTDHRVIQMLDFFSQVTVKAQNLCPKHERQPLNFFCKACLLPVCRDCTVLDHKEGQGHEIVDVSAAISENSDDFNQADTTTKDILGKLKARSDGLANASKRLDILDRQVKGNIKDKFIEYRLLLERRQQGMIDIMKQNIKEQKQKINSRFVEVCTLGSDCQKVYDNFTTARSANDVKALFTAHQTMKENVDKSKDAAEINDDELFKTFTFDVENELPFLSELTGLGDVSSAPDLELKNPVPAHQLVLLDNEERRQIPRINPLDCEDYYTERQIPIESPDVAGEADDGLRGRLQRIQYTVEGEDDSLEYEDEMPDDEGVAENSSDALANLRARLMNLDLSREGLLGQLRIGDNSSAPEERGGEASNRSQRSRGSGQQQQQQQRNNARQRPHTRVSRQAGPSSGRHTSY